MLYVKWIIVIKNNLVISKKFNNGILLNALKQYQLAK